jgi:hypothetical protein
MTTSPHHWASNQALQMTRRLRGNDKFAEFLQPAPAARKSGPPHLAARAPALRETLERAREEGLPYLILDGKVVAADRLKEKTVSRKGKEIDRGIPARRTASAGTSRPCSPPAASRCGSPRSCPAAFMTSLPPVSTPSPSCGPS